MMIDSFAWIEYFMGTKKGEAVREVVESDVQLYTSPIVIAEIYSKSLRTDGRAEERRSFIVKRCAVIPIDDEIAVERLSHNYPTANRNYTCIWQGMISPISERYA